jgi:thiosulfate dehydrogenase [quinone] large subunit
MIMAGRWTMQAGGVAVALFRIGFGVLWLDMALQKAPWVVSEGRPFGWLYGWIQKEIEHPTFALYKAFLEGVVVPNFTLFGWMTFLAEMAFGLSLLLGLFTVLGGVGGALWQLNIALGAYSVPGEWYWIWFLLIFPHVVFAAARAGRVLGVDGLLVGRAGVTEAPRTGLVQLLLRVA